MYDMLKENDLSGAQLLQICKSQLVGETSVDVLTDVMRSVVPITIKNYIPLEIYEQSHHDMFELFLGILASGEIKDKSTQELVMEAIFTCARNEDHIEHLVNWFKSGFIHSLDGKKLE